MKFRAIGNELCAIVNDFAHTSLHFLLNWTWSLQNPSSNMNSSLNFRAHFLLIFVSKFLIGYSCPGPSTEGNLTIGLILPYSTPIGGRALDGKFYASAITIAVDNINKDPNLLPGIRLRFVWDDSECLEEKSINALISQFERKVDAFIGFGCDCHTQARMAAALNLPVISHVSIYSFLLLVS